MSLNSKPYNCYINVDQHLVLEVAVAGFSIEELEISRTGEVVYVSGHKSDKSVEVVHFLARNLSYRDFRDVFIIPTQWKLEVAELINGVLRIKFFEERENVPITVVKPKKVKESA